MPIAFELDEIDRRLTVLRQASGTLGSALFDIDATPTRAMLDPKALRGVTAARVTPILATLGNVWERYPTVSGILDRIEHLRNSPRVSANDRVQITELLTTPSADGLLPDALAMHLNGQLDTVRVGMQSIGEAWLRRIPQVEAIVTRLAAVTALAASLSEQRPALEQLSNRAAELRDNVTADPLGVDDRSFVSLDASLTSIESDLQMLRTKRAGLMATIATLSSRTNGLRSVIAEGIAAAQRARDRIAGQSVKPPLTLELVDGPTGFRRRIKPLSGLATRDWRQGIREVDSVLADFERTEAEAQAVIDVNVGLVEQRDQLRGRLASLKVKAARTGAGEIAAISELHQAAFDALHANLIDLAAAEELVTRYAHAVSSATVQTTSQDQVAR